VAISIWSRERFTLNKSGDIILSKTFFCTQFLGRTTMLTVKEVFRHFVSSGEGQISLKTLEIRSANGLRLFEIHVEWDQGESRLWQKGENRFRIQLRYADIFHTHQVDARTAWFAACCAVDTTFTKRNAVLGVGHKSYGDRSLDASFVCPRRDSFEEMLDRWLSLLATKFELFLGTPDAVVFSLPCSSAVSS
jgi:hypothetical protein